MTSRYITSSWVRSLSYHPYAPEVPTTHRVAGTHGFLILTTRQGNQYGYAVPFWICGLLMATYVRTGHVGPMLNRWVIGKWPSVKMEARA